MNSFSPPPPIAAGLAALSRRWPTLASNSRDEPIFVLAAGWRSGSTAVQRALFSQCLVWGEPYGHAGILPDLANPCRALTSTWPPDRYFFAGQPLDQLVEQFVANLYPSPVHWLRAQVRFFDEMFARPARAIGKARWGFKEVRLSADHASWLRWLFPRCKLIFLVRDPYDAYRSFAARMTDGGKWFRRWPHEPIDATLFGRHWQELAASFVSQAGRLSALFVRQEDLNTGGWQRIADYVGFALDERAMAARPQDGPPPLDRLSDGDRALLSSAVEPLARQLGYGGESSLACDLAAATRRPASAVRETLSPCPPAKCAVLVPVAQSIEPACEAALQELERRGYTVRRIRGYADIALGRSQMASDALADGFLETMWIDADTGFRAADVDRLRSHPHPIVGGIYPKKGKRELAIHVLPGTERIVFGAKGGLVEVKYAATGFLLVRRAVYDAIREQHALPNCRAETGRTLVPYFTPLVHPDGDGWWYLAEDFAFCERARQCGFAIWADSTIRLWHIGAYAFGWEDAGGGGAKRYRGYEFRLTKPGEATAASPD